MAKKNKLKGFAIWDANQLISLIDGQMEIRARFSHFFTAGDLLFEFAKAINFGQLNADSVLSAYLINEFVADEDARLSQAGDRSEDRIRLADVFVDLPSSSEPPVSQEDDRDFSYGKIEQNSLYELLKVGSKKLDPSALHSNALQNKSDIEAEMVFGRFVYLGGPGSGKSTIGQFLAQVHRAALIARKPPQRLEQNVRDLVSAIRARCDADSYTWPATPRYPFKIELNAFAKALSANKSGSLLTLSAYLRKQLSKNTPVSHEDLRKWLVAYPWVIVFDGLDEVPRSSNRKEVIAAIQEFLSEARDLEADLLIVASSRPDGYAGEFDGSEVAHRHLLPLSKEQALLCAKKYVDAKIARRDDRRAKDAMETLTNAVENPLIEKLMHSPLQVTFMVTVVAASGKPSESRWQLFNDYYRTIYERELHKAVPPFDKALNLRRSDIDALHHRVGFILQARAESSGGTQADMDITEFESIVRDCLGENGLPIDELKHQVDMIMGAANQRLVFLTSRTPGRLSFDVRSLQEYMAAACITNEDSSEAIKRIEGIAHSSYWRNVSLFAVGRFFVEPHLRPHRDKIRVICDDLNRRTTMDAKTKLGSRLSLEILVSGVTGDVPLVNRALCKIALELLDFPPGQDDSSCARLAAVYRSEAQPEYESGIRLRLGQRVVAQTYSAWLLLKNLADKGILWAESLIDENWPTDADVAIEIFSVWHISYRSQFHLKLTPLAVKKIEIILPRLTLGKINRLFSSVYFDSEGLQKTWLVALIALFRNDDAGIKVFEHDKFVGLQVHVLTIAKSKNLLIDLAGILAEPNCNSCWQPLFRLAAFVRAPSRLLKYLQAESAKMQAKAFVSGSPFFHQIQAK